MLPEGWIKFGIFLGGRGDGRMGFGFRSDSTGCGNHEWIV
jgi:hypothetical protein